MQTQIQAPFKRFLAPGLNEAECKKNIASFLQEQIANDLKKATNQVPADQPVNQMLDQAQVNELSKKIEEATGFNYPPTELSKSINEISQEIFNGIQFLVKRRMRNAAAATMNQTKDKNPAVVCCERKQSPKMRLFCFPLGGGDATSLYFDWAPYFSNNKDIEVCPFQFSHKDRAMLMESKPEKFIPDFYQDLKEELQLPYSIFCYCSGASSAFEFIRYLRRNNLPMPAHVFVTQSAAPQIDSINKKLGQELAVGLKALPFDFFKTDQQDLSDEQLKMLLGVIQPYVESLLDVNINLLKSKTFFAEYLKNFRGALSLLKVGLPRMIDYEYKDEEPFDFPITAFYGTRDTRVTEDEMLNWRNQTTNKFELYKYDGGHLFFVYNDQFKKEMIDIMTKEIEEKLT